MIEKLRSRGPIDVPHTWKPRAGIISSVLVLTGGFVGVCLLGVVAYAGYLAPRNAILIGLGFAGFVAAFAALSIVATREDL